MKSLYNPLKKEDYIDLKISKKQLKKLSKYLDTTPVTKKWIKAKVLEKDTFCHVKLKFHGTNKSHYTDKRYSYSIKSKDSNCYK